MSEEKINLAPFGIAGMVAAFVFAINTVIAICADPNWVFGQDALIDLNISDDLKPVIGAGFIISVVLTLFTAAGSALKSKGPAFWSGVFLVVGMICSVASMFKILEVGTPEQAVLNAMVFIFIFSAIIAGAVAEYQKGRSINAAVAAFAIFVFLIVLSTYSVEAGTVVGIIMYIIWFAVESVTMAFCSDKVYKDDAESC